MLRRSDTFYHVDLCFVFEVVTGNLYGSESVQFNYWVITLSSQWVINMLLVVWSQRDSL